MVFHSFCLLSWKSEKGVMLLETALTLPLLLLIMAISFEAGNYLLIKNKMARSAGVIGEMICRQNISPSTLQAMMGTVNSVMAPFTQPSSIPIVVSHIQNQGMTTNPNNMKISWQYTLSGGVSRLGVVGSKPSTLPGGLSVINTQTVVVTEVFFQYAPLVFSSLLSPQSFYFTSVFMPLSGTMNTLLPA